VDDTSWFSIYDGAEAPLLGAEDFRRVCVVLGALVAFAIMLGAAVAA
jgi:hypothetical protein